MSVTDPFELGSNKSKRPVTGKDNMFFFVLSKSHTVCLFQTLAIDWGKTSYRMMRKHHQFCGRFRITFVMSTNHVFI